MTTILEAALNPLARLRIRVGRSYVAHGPGTLAIARSDVDLLLDAGQPAPGAAFAPTWPLLRPALDARDEIKAAMRAIDAAFPEPCDDPMRGVLLAAEAERWRVAWERYERLFTAGMRITSGLLKGLALEAAMSGECIGGAGAEAERRSTDNADAWALGFRPDPDAWAALSSLARADGVLALTCRCGDEDQRAGACHAVIVARILAKLGATYEGLVIDQRVPPAPADPDARAERLLVCGRRTWTDRARVRIEIAGFAPRVVIEGESPGGGADLLAREEAEALGIAVEPYPVDEALDGRWPAAGMRRNRRQLRDGKPDRGLAFGELWTFMPRAKRWKPTGTGAMVRLMLDAGLPVRWVEKPGAPAVDLVTMPEQPA